MSFHCIAFYYNTLRGTITYPTWGKGKSFSIVPWERDMLVPRGVDVITVIVVDDHALVFVHYCDTAIDWV